MKKLILLAVMFSLLMPIVYSVNVINCTYLNLPNTQYILLNNLTGDGIYYNLSDIYPPQNISAHIDTYACIVVNNSNVTLNCNGYSLKGNNVNETYGIVSQRNYTAIKNCLVLNYSWGITLWSSHHSSLINNIVHGNRIGFRNLHTEYEVMENNTGYSYYANTSTPGYYAYGGIMFFDVKYGRFSNNKAYSNITDAFYYARGSHGYLINNYGISSKRFGIILDTRSDYNVVINNTAVSREAYAFSVWNSNSSNLTGNLFLGQNTGLLLWLANDNKFTGNIIVSNVSNSNTISFWLKSLNNIFARNTIVGPNSNLLFIDSQSGGNVFYLNNFTDTTRLYVNDTNGNNFYNAVVDGKNQGNIYANVIDESVIVRGNVTSSIPGLLIGTTGAVPYGLINSDGKFVCLFPVCSDGAPLTKLSGKTFWDSLLEILDRIADILDRIADLFEMIINFVMNSMGFKPFELHMSVNAPDYVHVGEYWNIYAVLTDQYDKVLSNYTCSVNTNVWGVLPMDYSNINQRYEAKKLVTTGGNLTWSVTC